LTISFEAEDENRERWVKMIGLISLSRIFSKIPLAKKFILKYVGF